MAQESILCVDAHDDTCELVAFLLGREGCRVRTATTAGDGLDLARSRHFDLYIIGDWLPDGRGVELIRRIRASDAVAPIVYYTAEARTAPRQEALGAGAQAVILKPSEPQALIDTVERLLVEAPTRDPREATHRRGEETLDAL
jgi:DNA-binding response OmpR family regulator